MTPATIREVARTTRYFRLCPCGKRHAALETTTQRQRWSPGSDRFGDYPKWENLGRPAGEIDTFVKCACGRDFYLKPVKGHVKESVACDSRCTEAKGHSCDCSCGGRNHGAGAPA